tara:strand:- start:42 stop:278 length:237 start_codon:yes stop_codon:yes gene_type:complete
MPAKWKPSERVFAKDARGRRINTTSKIKQWKHYYLHETPKQELIDYLNKGQKPKIKVKAMKELTRRGVKIVWTIPQSS